jgi:hypothetical protein
MEGVIPGGLIPTFKTAGTALKADDCDLEVDPDGDLANRSDGQGRSIIDGGFCHLRFLV